MKNKKFVATLLHACTFYCVSAYPVQEYPVAGNEFREYAGQIASDRSGEEIAAPRHSAGALIPVDKEGARLSPEISSLLKACSFGKAPFAFKYLLFRQISFYSHSFPVVDFPLAPGVFRRVPALTPLPARVRFPLCTGSEGNATWIEHCLTNGP